MSIFTGDLHNEWQRSNPLPQSLVVPQKTDHVVVLEDALCLWKDLLDIVPEDIFLADGRVFININMDNSSGTRELLV